MTQRTYEESQWACTSQPISKAYVRRCREQERDDVVVTQSLDHSGKEIRHGTGGDYAEEHNHLRISVGNISLSRIAHQDPHFDIGKCKLQAVEESLLLAPGPIILADIFFESPDCELPLFLGQPGGRAREVWKNEECRECNDDRDDSLDDEQPSPATLIR